MGLLLAVVVYLYIRAENTLAHPTTSTQSHSTNRIKGELLHSDVLCQSLAATLCVLFPQGLLVARLGKEADYSYLVGQRTLQCGPVAADKVKSGQHENYNLIR